MTKTTVSGTQSTTSPFIKKAPCTVLNVTDNKKLHFKVANDIKSILRLRHLAEEALAESRFRGANFSIEKFTKAAERAAADTSRHGVLIATRSDRPIGFAYCNIGEPLVGTGLLITTVQVLYVGKTTRDTLLGGKAANALLNGVLSWSKSRRAEELLIHTTSGIKADVNDRFLRRRGFKVVGGSYAFSIKRKNDL